MHRNIFLISCSLVSWASAQFSSSQFPTCAVTCFTEVWPQSGCEITDTKCLCLNASYRNSFRSCAQNTCSANDYQTTVAQSLVICQNVGVTLTTSAYAGATGGSSGSSGDKAPSNNGGLSSGSKIGLAAGIPCALLFFLSLGGLFLLHLRRQKKKANKPTVQHSPPEMILPPEMLPSPHMTQQSMPHQQQHMMGWQTQDHGHSHEHKDMVVEVQGQQKYGSEMETHANRAELG